MKHLEKNSVKYALYMCAVLALCLILMQVSGTGFDSKSPFMTFATFIAPFIIWFLGIRAYKKQLKGKMTFKQGVKEGFFISLAFGIISPFIFLVFYLLNPSVLDYVQKTYGLTSLPIELVVMIDMLVQFISAIIFGTLYGAFISLFLKSKGK